MELVSAIHHDNQVVLYDSTPLMPDIHDIEDTYGSIAATDHSLALMLHEVNKGGESDSPVFAELALTPDRERSRSDFISSFWISGSRPIDGDAH
jgi:hypothetical protein